ncbi:hypothetical protein JT27_18070 [Alcaligenes faecalis]|uniref:hypothetical protein n=1 Tax=Alcaligenes faecalis TaxID=511 RepID=UPI00052D73BC|nr:hypothetical protein [Alcaligenes faecalis]KGP00240.1 hypothetical protein JT27_18070 [Alcaligenes faecalis]
MKIEQLFSVQSFTGQDLIDLFRNMEDEGVWDYEENDEQDRHDYLSELGYTEEEADVVQDLYDHCSGYVPANIVAGNHFEDYAREYAQECGYVDKDNPLVEYVDWAEWAENMKQDFTEVESGIHIFFVSDN